MWEAIAKIIESVIEHHGAPTRKELEEVVLALVRRELDVRDLVHALDALARKANEKPAPVVMPRLDLADVGIRHAERGWLAGEMRGAPLWSLHASDANRYPDLDAAERALVLHGLRGAPGVAIETITED